MDKNILIFQDQLATICKDSSDAQTRLLKLARAIQPFVPFDFISAGPSLVTAQEYDDIGFLRVGFDEYQFVSEKELLTISGLNKHALSIIVKNSCKSAEAAIANEISSFISLQKLIFDTFGMRSVLTFPVLQSDGSATHYVFYSRCRNYYMNSHLALLQYIKINLKGIAEKIFQTNPILPASQEFDNVIGNHPQLLAALDLTAQVAGFNTSVLILGESGTGKEKIAQSIHALSPRKDNPFIKVNCAAIPAMLIESELFGHEKGAFTGAIEKRKGKFEQACGGTIFLDEIGELPLDMQVKLLRVLQEKEIETIGGSGCRKVDVRIVSATNRDLEEEVANGNFRMDLYYRLNVFPISLPPLRERKSDIKALALYFANKFCKEFKKRFTGIGEAMMEKMYNYDWPGNIRELENVMEQSVILNDGKSELELKRNLKAKTITPVGKVQITTLEDVRHIQRETERDYIISVLKQTGGRIRGLHGAAQLLNLKPTTLEAKMAKLKIKKEEFISYMINL